MTTLWRTASLTLSAFFLSVSVAGGQDLVPGAYVPAPIGFNILTFYGGFSAGGVSFDPTLPVEDAKARIGSAAVSYGRTFGLFGRVASIGGVLPYAQGHIEGELLGQFLTRDLSGLTDPVGRFAINLFGAPAMTLKEFAAYRPRTLVGVSLTVLMPLGEYDESRYVNLGRNRWLFKPEVGISTTHGPWTIETDLGVTMSTANEHYVDDTTLEQAPIFAVQAHLTYRFKPALWIAMDANYWTGGRLTRDGVDALEQQGNSRMGVTAAIPFFSRQLRVAYSFGAYTRLGSDFHSLGVSYSHAWR